MRARQPTTCKVGRRRWSLAAAIGGPRAARRVGEMVTTVGLGGWQVQSSAQATQPAAAISHAGLRHRLVARTCGPTTPARSAPRSARSCRTGHCPNVFFSTNMKTVLRLHEPGRPGHDPASSRCRGGSAPTFIAIPARRAAPNWSSTASSARPTCGSTGTRSRPATPCRAPTRATRSTSRGLLRRGANALALEVYPNDPNTMFTLDNVDWTQIPPDNNTGIQFPIQLHTSGPLALGRRARRRGRRARSLDRGAHAEGAT